MILHIHSEKAKDQTLIVSTVWVTEGCIIILPTTGLPGLWFVLDVSRLCLLKSHLGSIPNGRVGYHWIISLVILSLVLEIGILEMTKYDLVMSLETSMISCFSVERSSSNCLKYG